MRLGVGCLAIVIVALLGSHAEPTRAQIDPSTGETTLYLPSVGRGSAPALAVVDRIGGRTSMVAAVDESHFLAGIGSRLVPYAVVADGDLDPTGPAIQLPGLVRGMAVDGTRALVVTEHPSGLYVVDAGEPERPRLMGAVQTDGKPVDIAVAGGRTILCEERHIRAVELTEDLRLHVVGSYALYPRKARTCALTASGSLLLGANEPYASILTRDLILVIDVTDVASPQLVGEDLAPPGAVLSLAADGGDAYVFLGATNFWPPLDRDIGQQLLHLDVSVPSDPVVVGTTTSAVRGGWSGALAMRDGLLYVADPTQLAVHDAASGDVIGTTPLAHPVFSATVVGDHAVVAGHGLSSVAIEDPSEPLQAARLDVSSEIVAITQRAGTVYAIELEGSTRQLRLAEIDSSGPRPSIRNWRPVGVSRESQAIDLAVTDWAAVVLAADEAHVFDLRDGAPDAPIASLPAPQAEMRYLGIEAMGDGQHVIALSHGDYHPSGDCESDMLVGLDVIDVGPHRAPRVISEARICLDESYPWIEPTDLRVSSEQALFTVWRQFSRKPRTYSSGGTVVAVDISDPWEPREVARYEHAGWPLRDTVEHPGVFGVAADASHVYLGGTASGLAVLELDGDGGFRQVGSYAHAGQADRIVLDGGVAYLADNGGFRLYTEPRRPPGSLKALDVSRPDAPKLLAAVEPTHALDMTIVDGDVWVAAGADGLAVFRAAR